MRKEVGKQLAVLRKSKGLSQRKLAEISGYSYANIAKIETGKYNVSIDILGKILECLNARIKIEELY